MRRTGKRQIEILAEKIRKVVQLEKLFRGVIPAVEPLFVQRGYKFLVINEPAYCLVRNIRPIFEHGLL